MLFIHLFCVINVFHWDVQVLNCYDLNGFVHLKTVPVMDVLDCIVLLNDNHSNQLIAVNNKNAKNTNKKIAIVAGEKGLLRMFSIEFSVRNDSQLFLCCCL